MIELAYRFALGAEPPYVHAWYPQQEIVDETLLVWVAPADGGWAVYHGSVYGPLSEESAWYSTELDAVTEAELWLTTASWSPTPLWPLAGY